MHRPGAALRRWGFVSPVAVGGRLRLETPAEKSGRILRKPAKVANIGSMHERTAMPDSNASPPGKESARFDRIRDGTVSPSALRFEEVVEEWQRPLLRYATRVVRDPDAAQDIVQTAFMRLFQHWDKVAPSPERIRPWLFRTVHNAAVDYIRKEERLRTATQRAVHEQVPLVSDPPMPGAEAGAKDRLDIVRAAFDQLSPAEREILVLRLEHGLSYREIADATHRTVGNVGCLLHHAVRKIANHLKSIEARES